MDAADEKANELLPCWCSGEGHEGCPVFYRPAVAAALRERDTALEQERHFHELVEDRLRTALQRIAALEAENAELRASIAHPPLRAWSPT